MRMWRYGVTSHHDVTWHHTMTSRHDIRWHLISWQRESAWANSENPKITFFNLVTLSFDLCPWPLNSFEILSMSNPTPNFRSVCQTVQPWESWMTDRQTHGHTDGTDSIPSTAYAGGKYKANVTVANHAPFILVYMYNTKYWLCKNLSLTISITINTKALLCFLTHLPWTNDLDFPVFSRSTRKRSEYIV